MVRLTADLIKQSAQYFNCCNERELCLRGYQIPSIENLGATFDQFTTIDLSDNDIKKLDGFPLLRRLTVLLLNNNTIMSIAAEISKCLPNLEVLILTGNHVSSLANVHALISFKYLRMLSLLNNPVADAPHYRLYIIHHIPQLKVLDFQKIKMKEREQARVFFESEKGREVHEMVKKTIKAEISKMKAQRKKALKDKDVSKIINAIESATSLAEIDKLKTLLQSGQIPEFNQSKFVNGVQNGEIDSENPNTDKEDANLVEMAGEEN